MSDSNILSRTKNLQEQKGNVANQAWNAGKAWLDIMTGFQRASMMAFAPFVRMPGTEMTNEVESRMTARLPQPDGVHTVEVGEERLNVGTVTVPGETTRIRRRVVSQPVEQRITLRDEKVVVERRAGVNADPTSNVLTETTIEMSDSRQVPRVWKSLHVAEEIVLRKQVTERVEHVRDTVRRDVVEVEHDADHIVVPQARIETRTNVMALEAEAANRAQAQVRDAENALRAQARAREAEAERLAETQAREVENAQRAQAQARAAEAARQAEAHARDAEAARRAQAANEKRAQEEANKKPGSEQPGQPPSKKN